MLRTNPSAKTLFGVYTLMHLRYPVSHLIRMKAILFLASSLLLGVAIPRSLAAVQAAPTPTPSPSPEQAAPPPSQPDATPPLPDPSAASVSSQKQEQPPKLPKVKQNDRIFGVIPNYRTVEDEKLQPTRIDSAEKFKLGLEDSFDYFAYPSAGIFAGIAMAQNQTKSFGQGAAGFGKYYGTAFADQTIGNMMSESVFPSLLHQDPRYFPLAKGGFWKRTRYSISREWITRNDSGKTGFNYSELGGNAVAIAISNTYYPSENRTASNNAYKYGQQIGLDAFFNILKEFWPDIRRKMFGK
jgi:hypothetical protein